MSLVEIKKLFEQRKYNLIRTLDNGREDIDLSKQHQMYGAIKELENILKSIDYYRELETENDFDFKLSRETEKTVLQKISLKFKNKKEVIKQ